MPENKWFYWECSCLVRNTNQNPKLTSSSEFPQENKKE